MIINQLDVCCVAAFESEYDSPVGPDRNSPESLAVALEGMQMMAGKIKSLRDVGSIEDGQNSLYRRHQVRSYAARIAAFIKAFQPAVPDTGNHQRIVK